jgi:hypothetical protein
LTMLMIITEGNGTLSGTFSGESLAKWGAESRVTRFEKLI